jgi:hypothetical protein
MITQTLSDWNTYPPRFQNALKRAQMLEANSILGGNQIADKRRDGIISETIGESKIFLNNRPPLRTPVTREALEALYGYLYYQSRVGRA